MPDQARKLSQDLLIAQQRLVQLRVSFQTGKRGKGETAVSPSSSSPPSPASFCLPAHLGWHSQPFAALQQTAVSLQNQTEEAIRPIISHPAQSQPTRPNTITLHPDIAVGMLRTESAAAGRIWLLLRHLDTVGCGWVPIAEARDALTQKQYATRVCGRRQLRNLLAQGEGLFWVRENGRIWLRSLPKVAAALGINKLSSKPVALSVSVLTERIGTVRAHFYAGFHSGRTHSKPGATVMKPIARSTIQKITHVHPRIQRRYEKTAKVKSQRNFSVGASYAKETAQTAAWQRGTAVFPLTDKNGRFGRPGKTYMAWQLPNSYTGPHQLKTSNRRKRINRALTDLMPQGTTGNDQCMSVTEPEPFVESGVRYCENGRFAAKTIRRDQIEAAYWPELREGGVQMWHELKKP